MKIKVSCEVIYDTQDVINDLSNDYPNDSFSEDDAKTMIYQWIKDDFEPTMLDYKVEEIA